MTYFQELKAKLDCPRYRVWHLHLLDWCITTFSIIDYFLYLQIEMFSIKKFSRWKKKYEYKNEKINIPRKNIYYVRLISKEILKSYFIFSIRHQFFILFEINAVIKTIKYAIKKKFQNV